MKKFTVLIISIFWASVISWAANAGDIEATTDEGKQVLLKYDGTWQYVLKAKTDDGREFLLNNDGTWHSIDSEVSRDLTELDQTVVLIFEKEKEKSPRDVDEILCVIENIHLIPESLKQLVVKHQGMEFDFSLVSDDDWEIFKEVKNSCGDQEFLRFLKSKADLWKKAGECLTNEVTSIPKQVKEVIIKYKGDPDSYKKISSGNKKKWKKILGKCMG